MNKIKEFFTSFGKKTDAHLKEFAQKIKAFCIRVPKALKRFFMACGIWIKGYFVSTPEKKAGFIRCGLWFKNKFFAACRGVKEFFVPTNGNPPGIKLLPQKSGFINFSSSIVCILIGVVFGLVLMICVNPSEAFYGLGQMLVGSFSTADNFGQMLFGATPLIMTGLAVGFAFKTGLFNIGASGQYLMGAFFALFAAIVWQFPWYLALITAIIGGALWGAIPGIFKALLNVNEVITSIMFNWIGLYAVNMMFANAPGMLAGVGDRTQMLQSVNPGGVIPSLGLDQLFGTKFLNIGIFIAIIVAIVVFVILNKTTFGYELKACGHNRNASEYAGIKSKKNIIFSMVISGGLAGLGGGLYYLTNITQYVLLDSVVPAMGFNGIPVALLALSNPVGTIFTGLFVSFLTIGGNAMQPEFSTEIINIIISVIIYLSAFSLLFRSLIKKWLVKKKGDDLLKTENVQDPRTSVEKKEEGGEK